jgi:hypothetical protein
MIEPILIYRHFLKSILNEVAGGQSPGNTGFH